jgi:hypothetical protein
MTRIGQVDTAHRGIQRREQLVGRESFGTGELVE